MNEILHKQLIEAGIPLERHNAAALSQVFPPEFKVADFGLSASEIAKVLVVFIKRGLISVSSMPDEAAVRRMSGSHVCHFYREQEEMVRMTAAFLEDGLRTGERCLWVLPSWLDESRARAASRAARPPFADPVISSRLFFLTESAVYLNAAGTLRSAPEIIGFWLEQEKKAKEVGFIGIRITGDGTALVSTDDWESGVEYERLADAEFRDRNITALCTYSLASISPSRLARVLSGHECGLIRRGETWDEVHSGSGVSAAIGFFQAAASSSTSVVHV